MTKQPRPDPVFAAIEVHRRAEAIFNRICRTLDLAEGRAKKKHGLQPLPLVAWRNYSAIGGGEIEKARDEFLALPAIDPKKIMAEYRDAKARERAQIAKGRKWDRRTGIAALRRRFIAAEAASERAAQRMAETPPHTIAGAMVLLQYTRDDMRHGAIAWHELALASVGVALAELARKYEWKLSRKLVAKLAQAKR